MSDKPKTIAQYIKAKPDNAQPRLHEMYDCLMQVAPKAEQGIKWGSPAFTEDRILFTFAAFKNHISLFPTPAVIRTFAAELEKYATTKASIHFPLDKPLPKTLIKKILRYRAKEVREKGAKWM